ncbi:MAG: type II secretion system major pseudopilin GspG [Planctomycetota bacterium]
MVFRTDFRPRCGYKAGSPLEQRFQRLHSSARGFSLVEVMVVVVIIGLLAGLVGINVRGQIVRAKRQAALAEIATIQEALEAYYTVYDRYPTSDEGLEVLWTASERLVEPLLDDAPLDPWRRPYVYNRPGRNGPYEVFSLGADGREGGEPGTADEDLGSYQSVNEGAAE